MFSCNQVKRTENLRDENLTSGNKQIYLYAENSDTTLLELETIENTISGKLDILIFQKDSRIGEIFDGKMKGDTLFAMYRSMQEGHESDCEIAFLKKGNSFILTNDIFYESNYHYNSDYTKGSFKDKNLIKFDGETLKLVTSK